MLNTILLNKLVPIGTASLILSFSTLTVHIQKSFAESSFLKVEAVKAEDTPLLRALQNVSSKKVEIRMRMHGTEVEERENPNVFATTVVNPSTVRAFQAIY